MSPPFRPRLSGVSATMLWTLYSRSSFPQLLCDPRARQIRDSLDVNYRGRFGAPQRSFALRSAQFDRHLQAHLDRFPRAPVVSLGEGLETQCCRVHGYGRWTSVDLPQSIAVRRHFFAEDADHVLRAESATEGGWLPEVAGLPGFVVAQGLFMYLKLTEVESVVRRWWATTGAGGALLFDVVPPWVSRVTRFGSTGRFTWVPPMPWGMGARSLARSLVRWTDGRATVTLEPVELPSGPLPSAARFTTVAALVRRPSDSG